MNTLAIEISQARAQQVEITADSLSIDLIDGRTIKVPLTWFPRLLHGDQKERSNWRWIGKGEGIHWLDLDEDISIENLLLGKASGESQASFKAWLEKHNKQQRRRRVHRASVHPTMASTGRKKGSQRQS